jgi:hypothetical protein
MPVADATNDFLRYAARKMPAVQDCDQPVSESCYISIRNERTAHAFFDGLRKSAGCAGDNRDTSNYGF